MRTRAHVTRTSRHEAGISHHEAVVVGTAVTAALGATLFMIETLRCATLWLHGVPACGL